MYLMQSCQLLQQVVGAQCAAFVQRIGALGGDCKDFHRSVRLHRVGRIFVKQLPINLGVTLRHASR